MPMSMAPIFRTTPRIPSALLLIVACSLLPARYVLCGNDDAEEHLLQGLNSFRTASNLAPLTKHDNAHCLAETIADKLESSPCPPPASSANPIPGTGDQFADYPKMLSKCGINDNTVRDGIILPVCVSKLVPTLVLTNYTHSPYAKYVNDSRYTGAGVEAEDDWMVVVLATASPGGSFASGTTPAPPQLVGMIMMVFVAAMVAVVSC